MVIRMIATMDTVDLQSLQSVMLTPGGAILIYNGRFKS